MVFSGDAFPYWMVVDLDIWGACQIRTIPIVEAG